MHTRAQLLGLAELIHDSTGAAADQAIRALLACRTPELQTGICEHVFRPLMQGPTRARITVDVQPPTDDLAPATILIRQMAISHLKRLPVPEFHHDDGRRDATALLHDALDYANLPCQTYADLLKNFSIPGASSAMWTDPTRLGAFVVPAALGGHEGARRALTTWCRPARKPTSDRATARQLIGYRLQRRLAETAEALPYLVDDATTTADCHFLTLAFEGLNDEAIEKYREHYAALGQLTRELTDAPRGAVRLPAYRLWARLTVLVIDPPVGTWIARTLTRERDPSALHATLKIIEATLQRDAARWSAEDYETIISALTLLTGPGAAPNQAVRNDADAALREAICRGARLTPHRQREETIDRVRQLILHSPRQQASRPLGFLLSRLAKVDPSCAADLLTAASHHIAAIGSPTASWKSRRARQWREPLTDIIAVLNTRRWRQLMADLTTADPYVFVQALDISLQTRKGHPEQDLSDILDERHAAAPLRQAFLTARKRHERVAGGVTTWPELMTGSV